MRPERPEFAKMRKDLPEDPSWIRALNRIRHTINTYGHETKPDGELISPMDHFLQDLKSCSWKLPWQFDRTKPILGAIAFVLYDQECSEPPPAYVDEETKVRHLPELNVGWLVNPFKPLIEYMKFRSGAPIDSYASCPSTCMCSSHIVLSEERNRRLPPRP